ncbi:MAG: winged helix-turn-helix transcriptional regulator [Paracoccus sp. (in: a-proteobacteria)]|nr:winged helix-turn-helix transcriptional regulator [Paracoccus sp. (in: a-proteobacteria)]
MDINFLVNMTSRAWVLPILASFHEGVPGRQAALLKATGASRSAFAQSMQHMIQSGLVERNPGHGHPLRPEFRLTASGAQVAAMAGRLQTLPDRDDLALLRRTWTLPVLTSLRQPRHFSEIRGFLPGITDRALSQSLNLLEEKEWVMRDIQHEARPPRPIYSAINAGAMISHATVPEVSLHTG